MITITIDGNGMVVVKEGEELIGLLSHLSLECDKDLVAPRMRIKFSDYAGMLASKPGMVAEFKARKARLRQYTFLSVEDPNDTLPSGMPAVSAEETGG